MALEYYRNCSGLVIDVGSRMVKAGFSGDDAPRCVFPSHIGSHLRNAYAEVMVGCRNHSEVVVGDEASARRGIVHLLRPLECGIVTHFDHYERLLHHTFYNELSVAPEEHPVLLTEHPFNPISQRVREAQVMFEVFDVYGLAIVPSPVLDMYSLGETLAAGQGLLLHCGDTVSYCAAFSNFGILPLSVVRENLGGRDVTDFFAKLMLENGRGDFTQYSGREIVGDMKEKQGFVSSGESPKSNGELPQYELPDGTAVQLGSERWKAAEVLFNPSLYGFDSRSVVDLVKETLTRCGDCFAKDCSDKLPLWTIGSTTTMTGFVSRVVSELGRSKQSIPVSQATSFRDICWSPKFATWLGGSVMSSLSWFPEKWISKPEYKESGEQILHKKSNMNWKTSGLGMKFSWQ